MSDGYRDCRIWTRSQAVLVEGPEASEEMGAAAVVEAVVAEAKEMAGAAVGADREVVEMAREEVAALAAQVAAEASGA